MPKTLKKQKTRALTGKDAGLRTSLDFLERVHGIGGVEQSAQTLMDERSAVFKKKKYRH